MTNGSVKSKGITTTDIKEVNIIVSTHINLSLGEILKQDKTRQMDDLIFQMVSAALRFRDLSEF